MTDYWQIMFWLAVTALGGAFLGYPAVIYLFGRRWPKPVTMTTPANLPQVTILLVVHNEENSIEARLRNLLAADYPSETLQVVVVSDGSVDRTVERVRALADPRVILLERPIRQGKAAGLNQGLALAAGEVVVFADARQTFDSQAVARLVRNFRDPRVGAVSGNYTMNPSASNVGGGVDAYWRLEKFIRRAESLYDSSVGVTGAIYAIRRRLFRELPNDTILDDVVIPMQVALAGYRVVFEPEALAFDPRAVEPGREFVRKRRTLAGNFQMLFRYWRWCLPWHNRLWWQLIGHKYSRLAAPLFLAAALGANAALCARPFYAWLLGAQGLFYLLAASGILFRRLRIPVFTLPAGFVFLNAMTVAAFWHYLFGQWRQGWQKVES